jgi:hypothetical protein
MAETEILPQKIVDTKTIILKPRLDSNRVRLQGDKLKTNFFARSGFLKPRYEDIVLVSFSKYYEPYIVIGGKYSIDYCKKYNYALEVEDKTQEIFIDGKKLKPEPLAPGKTVKVIKLVGEEHSHYESETYLILDRMMREVSSEKVLFAPFECELENQPRVDYDLRKPKISLEEEIELLRSRIAKRPSDVAEIIREIFEINERIIIYSPIYELTYQNIKNGKQVTALINGISGDVTLGKFETQASKKLAGNSLETSNENLPAVKTQFFRSEPEQSQSLDDTSISNLTIKDRSENAIVERGTDISSNSYESKDASWFNAENAAHSAVDFMKRLGYEQGQFPTKVFLDGENNVVELSLQKGTARVQINTKTGEVKEYEVQEAEMKQGFFTTKRKVLLFVSSIVAVATVLKLMNIF